ncbi:uncharacterized protein [Miscanthus floridulus]|uniref:uncharacterized protein n=1 Tax=Miscanthus floridulus TaxID=154761 RepID=UPI0034588D8C
MSLPLPASTAPPPDPNVSVPIPSAPMPPSSLATGSLSLAATSLPAGSLPLAARASSSAVGVMTNEQLTAAVVDLGRMMAGVHAFLLGPQPGVAPTHPQSQLPPAPKPQQPPGPQQLLSPASGAVYTYGMPQDSTAHNTAPASAAPHDSFPSRRSSFPTRRPRFRRGSPISRRRSTPPRQGDRRSIRPLPSHWASALGAFRRREHSMAALTAQSSTAPPSGPRRLQLHRSAGRPRLPLP